MCALVAGPVNRVQAEGKLCKITFEGKQPAEDVYKEAEKPEHVPFNFSGKGEPPEEFPSGGPITVKGITDSYKLFDTFATMEKGGIDHSRLAAVQKDKGKWEGIEGPQDYRKDYLPDGHLPDDAAWERFVADSKRTLDITKQNQKKWDRFKGCLEARKIVEDKRYVAACQANCPSAVSIVGGQCVPGVIPQKHEVYSYYLPVYTFILGKDGHRFVNPEMFEPAIQKRADLTLKGISKHHEEHIESNIRQQLKKKGLSDEFKRPGWHKDGKRLFLESWEHSDYNQMEYAMSTGGIRTNWVARLSDDRVPGTKHLGYKVWDRCFAWAAPEDTKVRKVLSNYMEAENSLNDIMIFPEMTKLIDEKKYDLVSFFKDPEYRKADRETDGGGSEALSKVGIVPRWRSWAWPGGDFQGSGWPGGECGAGFKDLEKVGINAQGEDINRGDVIYWSYETAPFYNVEFWNNPLFQAIANAGKTSLVLGSKHPALKSVNSDTRDDIKRHLAFTYYKDRYKKKRASYMNTRSAAKDDQYQCCKCSEGPCCARQLIGLDKFQLVFPPVAPNRGNECFELNSTPRQLNDANWPKSLLTFFQQYGLVHVTMWDYRVACACEICGVVQGCLTLNTGDNEEDLPEGSEPFPQGLPESIQAIQKYLEGYATNKGPYIPKGGQLTQFNMTGQKNGGTPGPLQEEDKDYCQGGGA